MRCRALWCTAGLGRHRIQHSTWPKVRQRSFEVTYRSKCDGKSIDKSWLDLFFLLIFFSYESRASESLYGNLNAKEDKIEIINDEAVNFIANKQVFYNTNG